MKVAVIKEAAPWERRVALVPEGVAKLCGAGLEVLAEAGAGHRSWIADASRSGRDFPKLLGRTSIWERPWAQQPSMLTRQTG